MTQVHRKMVVETMVVAADLASFCHRQFNCAWQKPVSARVLTII